MKEFKKFVKKLEKYGKFKKKLDNSEKNYIKELILQKKSNKKQIEPIDLSIRFGTTKENIEKIIEEINSEESKKIIKKVPKKNIFKNFLKQKKERLNFLDKKDTNTLKDIFLKIMVFGIPLNFSIWCFIYHPFSWFSWIGYGYTLWFIKRELINILRSLWFR